MDSDRRRAPGNDLGKTYSVRKEIMPKGNERRISERYGWKTDVIYEPSIGFSPKKKRSGKTVNVSQGGVCIKTDKPLAQSQIVRVRLPFSQAPAMAPTLAEVCWIEGLKPRKGYWVGLRFLL